ncbi:hypothetical protein DFP72DRAFT_830289 [Ephemerocybe angulata]|uniref:Dehydrogenase E1 component domain-containing protein n=1 Tax=Ephemerocybe angulata TaxID=980116 RepID=A0A8H6LVF1_9AGAR|nr:hypothetical protein DFP72DRAFT_830289 [Tulosesus angulatus]
MGDFLHRDAAFAGHGVIYETTCFHDLPPYCTRGTIYLIMNNQITITTDPLLSCSSPYSSDITKSIDTPIIHVNGDNI